ncbi:MAG: hypothetical protein ABI233_06765 [Chthoniobacterales bacterium]
MIDNGQNSLVQMPPGIERKVWAPRAYAIDQDAQTSTELAEYPGTEGVFSQFCGSTYEDAKSNYLVDYAYTPTDSGQRAEILGYDASGAEAFDYMYVTGGGARLITR